MLPIGRRRFLASGACAAATAACSTARGNRRPADLVVLNGKVLTVDPRFSVAEAAAVRDGLFCFVGSTGDAKALVGPSTRVIDAGGMSVVPGIIESHLHAADLVVPQEARDPFRTLGTIAEIQAWIRDKAAATPEGTWILTLRGYPTRLKERRFPTRAELDAAAPRHPVVFDGVYAHVLNTAALRSAGIARDTADPPGGQIVKGPDGEPTGLLRNARGLVDRFLPPRPVAEEELLRGLEAVHRRYLACGITSLVEGAANPEGYRLYGKLRAAGRLALRAAVTVLLSRDQVAGGAEQAIRDLPVRPGEGDDWLRVGPLKLWVDGGILIGTAYLREPYGPGAARLYDIQDPAYRGTLTLTPEQVREGVRAGHRLGWPMCTHVTGDAGADLVLDAVEAADAERPIRDRRFTLIHAYFTHADTVRRAAALGVCLSTQPAWYYKDADAIAAALGEERMRPFVGLAGWVRGGVRVAINSDHMFGLDSETALNPYNPFLTMGTAVTRKTEGGRVIGPEQRVSREDALRMMTTNAAALTFEEDRKGSIEVGKLGDLAVLDGDFMACPEDRIRDLRAVATVVGGTIVHGG